MYAFRCKNCGHLHAAEHAGTSAHPHACVACGAGVVFDAKGNKTFQPDNWEILTSASPERLAELGIENPVKHSPDHARVAAENFERSRAALDKLQAKKTRWNAEKATIVAKVHALEDELIAEEDKDEPNQHAIATVRQQIVDLVNSEWTARDDAHVAELEKAIAAGGSPPRSIGGKHFKRHAKDSVFSRDKS